MVGERGSFQTIANTHAEVRTAICRDSSCAWEEITVSGAVGDKKLILLEDRQPVIAQSGAQRRENTPKSAPAAQSV